MVIKIYYADAKDSVIYFYNKRYIFIVAGELAIPTGILTKESKAEIETHPVTVEAKIILTKI